MSKTTLTIYGVVIVLLLGASSFLGVQLKRDGILVYGPTQQLSGSPIGETGPVSITCVDRTHFEYHNEDRAYCGQPAAIVEVKNVSETTATEEPVATSTAVPTETDLPTVVPTTPVVVPTTPVPTENPTQEPTEEPKPTKTPAPQSNCNNGAGNGDNCTPGHSSGSNQGKGQQTGDQTNQGEQGKKDAPKPTKTPKH